MMRHHFLTLVACSGLLAACSAFSTAAPVPSIDSPVAARSAAAAPVAVPAPDAGRGTTMAQARPPGQQPTASSFRYTKSEGVSQATIAMGDQTVTAFVPRVRESWIGADGSGRIRQVAGDVYFAGAQDRAAWQALGAPDFTRGVTFDTLMGPGDLWTGEVATLPTDPVALSALLQARAAQTDNPMAEEMFTLVGDQLRETAAEPALRKALFAVAAALPGVERRDGEQDRRGRVGVALSLVAEHSDTRTRRTYLFDPATFALLAEQDLLLNRVAWLDAQPPVEIGWTTYLHAGTVASVNETP